MKSRAVIVGLGQVGIRFDLEPQRKGVGIWTHFSAYEKLASDFELVAAVDSKKDNWGYALERRPGLRCFESIEALLASGIALDIASICTPDANHLEAAGQLAPHVRAIFLEKPICPVSEISKARELIQGLKDGGQSIRVNYFKRSEPAVLELLSRLGAGGAASEVRHVQCKYAGPFDAVGSHAVDLIHWISRVAAVRGAVTHAHAEGEGKSALFSLISGGSAALLYTGPRHDLIFEVEVVTAGARYRLNDNLQRFEVCEARPSERYAGYREYFKAGEQTPAPNQERFVSELRALRAELTGNARPDYLPADRALETQALMSEIAQC